MKQKMKYLEAGNIEKTGNMQDLGRHSNLKEKLKQLPQTENETRKLN